MVGAFTKTQRRQVVVKTQNVRFRADPWATWRGAKSSLPKPSDSQGTHYANGTQELLLSYGHNLSRLGHGDVGGPFHCVKRSLSESNFGPQHNRTVDNDDNIFAYNYRGSYFAHTHTVSDSDFPVPATASDIELDAAGSTAIARILPTNPIAGLAVTLGELRREGLPSVVGSESIRQRALRARNAGSEYLNVEFGWRPLVDEVLGIATAITDSDDLIQKYVAESGNRLHRTYTYPIQTSSTETVATGQYPQPADKVGYWNATGTKRTVTTTQVEQWFKGCFTYHLAPQGSLVRQEQIAAKRFGHRITPEVLWNLTPWSWAADWVTNIGDVIHNVSAFANDGLVMPYGYMMTKTTVTKAVTLQGARTRYKNRAVDVSQTFRTIRKQRRKATPFGFGLDPASFTGRQWSILVALGLSRSPGQL